MQKRCTKCDTWRPMDQFARRGHGLQSWCRLCVRSRDHAAYRANDSRRRSMATAREASHARVRGYLLDYLRAHPCVDCGEGDIVVLQFDHVRGVKVIELARLRGCSLKRVMAEVAKCEVRCGNCHRRKTVRDLGWWIGAAVAKLRSTEEASS